MTLVTNYSLIMPRNFSHVNFSYSAKMKSYERNLSPMISIANKQLTKCCTQFKSPEGKIIFELYLHYNIASTLRNGPDKNDSHNVNEYVGIQLEREKVITFLLSVLTDWLKQQKLTKLAKAVLYSSLLSNHLAYNKIWSQFEYHRNRMWGTFKIVNVSWLLFSTLVIGQNLLTQKTPFQNGL